MTREEAIAELKYARAMTEFDPMTGEVYFRNDEDKRQAEAFDMAIKALEQEPKTGHWLDDNKNTIDAQYGRHHYRCSECSKYADKFVGGTEDWWDVEKSNFCPNCGAKMVEPQESEDKE